MKLNTVARFGAAFALLFCLAALAVIGGVKALTNHPLKREQVAAIAKANQQDVGITNIKAMAVQTVYQLSLQANLDVTKVKVLGSKVKGNGAYVTVQVETKQQRPVTLRLYYARGIWSFQSAQQL
jgi:hypothetical protein